PTALSTLSLHDALPIFATDPVEPPRTTILIGIPAASCCAAATASHDARLSLPSRCSATTRIIGPSPPHAAAAPALSRPRPRIRRSEEHTSELQSRFDLV